VQQKVGEVGMKPKRHAVIREIIENAVIETQEELADALRTHHIDVTQATVSRDIKNLMLVKVPVGNGRYRYAFPQGEKPFFSETRLARVFQDSVVAIDHSENIIVVKTLPGTANAVASVLDSVPWREIIGTVAGDDTILAVVKPKKAASIVAKRMEQLFDE